MRAGIIPAKLTHKASHCFTDAIQVEVTQQMALQPKDHLFVLLQNIWEGIMNK